MRMVDGRFAVRLPVGEDENWTTPFHGTCAACWEKASDVDRHSIMAASYNLLDLPRMLATVSNGDFRESPPGLSAASDLR